MWARSVQVEPGFIMSEQTARELPELTRVMPKDAGTNVKRLPLTKTGQFEHQKE